MIHGSALWLLVDALACFRLTRLIAVDTITATFRQRLLDRAKRRAFEHATAHGNAPTPHDSNVYGKVWDLVSCPWCISVWISAPVVALTATVPSVWQYPAAGLALTAVAGLLSEVV